MIRGRSGTVLRGRTQCFFVRNLNGRNWRGKLVERNLVFFYDAARRCGETAAANVSKEVHSIVIS